jgi:hypothetical protein
MNCVEALCPCLPPTAGQFSRPMRAFPQLFLYGRRAPDCFFMVEEQLETFSPAGIYSSGGPQPGTSRSVAVDASWVDH